MSLVWHKENCEECLQLKRITTNYCIQLNLTLHQKRREESEKKEERKNYKGDVKNIN
jgi:hypothetical protein